MREREEREREISPCLKMHRMRKIEKSLGVVFISVELCFFSKYFGFLVRVGVPWRQFIDESLYACHFIQERLRLSKLDMFGFRFATIIDTLSHLPYLQYL